MVSLLLREAGSRLALSPAFEHTRGSGPPASPCALPSSLPGVHGLQLSADTTGPVPRVTAQRDHRTLSTSERPLAVHPPLRASSCPQSHLPALLRASGENPRCLRCCREQSRGEEPLRTLTSPGRSPGEASPALQGEEPQLLNEHGDPSLGFTGLSAPATPGALPHKVRWLPPLKGSLAAEGDAVATPNSHLLVTAQATPRGLPLSHRYDWQR